MGSGMESAAKEEEEVKETEVAAEVKGQLKDLAKGTRTRTTEDKPNGMGDEASSNNMDMEGAEFASCLRLMLASNKSHEDTEMTKFANQLQCVFFTFRSTQWPKLFNELTRDTIARLIPDEVYQLLASWIKQRSNEALGKIVLGALDCIVADSESQRASLEGSMSQVLLFVQISMILRQKPDVLISLLPNLRENSRYYSEKKLPVFVWMIMQASQGDLTVGLYIWVREILPILNIKSNPSPESKDLVLKLVESILSAPNAKQILAAGFERKGEHLIPLTALELLLHLAFPSAPVEETERFEAIYPTILAIAGANIRGSDAMKLRIIHIQDIALRAIEEGNAKLSDKATSLFVFCLADNPECYKRWDSIYEDNVEKSIAILRKLEKLWVHLYSCDDLRDTLRSFRQKNRKALSGGTNFARHAVFREADELSEGLLRTLSRRWRHLMKLFDGELSAMSMKLLQVEALKFSTACKADGQRVELRSIPHCITIEL